MFLFTQESIMEEGKDISYHIGKKAKKPLWENQLRK